MLVEKGGFEFLGGLERIMLYGVAYCSTVLAGESSFERFGGMEQIRFVGVVVGTLC